MQARLAKRALDRSVVQQWSLLSSAADILSTNPIVCRMKSVIGHRAEQGVVLALALSMLLVTDHYGPRYVPHVGHAALRMIQQPSTIFAGSFIDGLLAIPAVISRSWIRASDFAGAFVVECGAIYEDRLVKLASS